MLDYYLEVKLDFSQATFVVTANDPNKIPNYLLSRMPMIVELPGYNIEQKREIANKFIQNKIKIDAESVHKIIPHDFFNIDLEGDTENKNDKRQLAILQQELERLKGEKLDQTQLRAVKFNTLLVLRQFRGQFEEKEYQNYEGKINTADSREEVEVIAKEFLLKIKQKNVSPKPSRADNDKDKKIKDELTDKGCEEKIKLSNAEIEKLKRKMENLQKQEKSRSIKDNALFIIVIVALII
ncbi:7387_t:CDS:2 [Ambispora gerdemannii]|uniref:7387_t:CDS:1 n=1 Tax=Ambispora gerdemannii TaxID=144530 RepID=A0A9N9B6U3_9GLOM|nr:7387_t:CDS:2 [Ambispora gerdemannii]